MKRYLLAMSLGALLVVATRGSSHASATQLVGVYPATVTSNADPTQTSRLLLEIPVLGASERIWATASMPYNNGAQPLPPPLGSTVWVEFEEGNPSYPVWIGWRP
jgi:hypothetical protein